MIADYGDKSTILREPSKEATENNSIASNLSQNEVGRVQILKKQDTGSSDIEDKADKLANQPSELSLFVKKKTERLNTRDLPYADSK